MQGRRKLVKLPDFLPGLGQLYVDPQTLPAGPFLAYDHTGRLVSTIYMVPLKDITAHKKLSGLAAAGEPVLAPGEHFEVTLTVEGVYDYLCEPHEQAGMVGRLIVGHPAGPGTLPFDWFKGTREGRTWLDVPEAARRTFPAIGEIMRRKRVPAPRSTAASWDRTAAGHRAICQAESPKRL
jgi:hypothetical protein